MATRSLMALDYSNYHTDAVLRKHARNRPLGAIEQRHNYTPAQPVLSCRTVDIDLPGTRTYRPKSTVDILEEQQRLIRSLRSRVAVSAPPRPVTEPAGHSFSDGGFKRVNIEVKGRPFTSQSQNSLPLESKPKIRGQRRPKTTGRLKNVEPATDSFMVIKVDQELLASNQNNRELTNKLHAYWKSDPQSLCQGRFVRGQKRPDDVPPSLDAWLTFGGAAGEGDQGVIDAFASFKNSEEYYNIEGSVGSRVAQQLQKGDKIRIGINGVVQSHDFKIKKWHKDGSGRSTPQQSTERRDVNSSDQLKETETAVQHLTVESTEDGKIPAEATNDDAFDDNDGDFKELVIRNLDDLLEDSPKTSPMECDEATTAHTQQEHSDKLLNPPVIVPLSWDDQCSKPDVKVLQATTSPQVQPSPVMSETYPVRFEKLIGGTTRPKLAQVNKDGYKIKQRPVSKASQRHGASSKVRVVYIDPLTDEDEARVNTLSVEEIISVKAEGSDKNSVQRQQHKYQHQRENKKKATNMNGNFIAINDDAGTPAITGSNNKGNSMNKNGRKGRGSRPSSHHSSVSDQGGRVVGNPKLKTVPVHPAMQQQQNQTAGLSDLSIMTNNKRNAAGNGDNARALRSSTPSRGSPTKRLGSGQTVASIRSAGHGTASGEAEYIKITSQLKMPASHPTTHPQVPYNFNPGTTTMGHADLDYQNTSPRDYSHIKEDDLSPHMQPPVQHQAGSNSIKRDDSDERPQKVNSASNKNVDLNDTRASSPLSESPPPTTVAISIPTADELSDRDESPNCSPLRGAGNSPDSAALTPMARRERDLRNEQIDQITDLLGGAIVEDS